MNENPTFLRPLLKGFGITLLVVVIGLLAISSIFRYALIQEAKLSEEYSFYSILTQKSIEADRMTNGDTTPTFLSYELLIVPKQILSDPLTISCDAPIKRRRMVESGEYMIALVATRNNGMLAINTGRPPDFGLVLNSPKTRDAFISARSGSDLRHLDDKRPAFDYMMSLGALSWKSTECRDFSFTVFEVID